MNYQEIKEQTRRIAELQSYEITAEDKALIRKCAADLGVQFSAGKNRCKACYIDAAILCYHEAARLEAVEASASDEHQYVLVPGTDVFFGSIRVNEATITDELAERLIERGFSKTYFVKC